MRPSTEGCTEWSCIYHGEENREKASHDDDCPFRNDEGWPAIEDCRCERTKT